MEDNKLDKVRVLLAKLSAEKATGKVEVTLSQGGVVSVYTTIRSL